MMDELNLEDLYGKVTSEEQIKESFERRTVPTGRYILQAERVTPRRLPSDHFLANGEDREVGTFAGPLRDDQGNRKGRIMFDASWDIRRKENGKMDGLSVLWGQICTALSRRDVGEVMDAMKIYPVSVYVSESFKTPEGYRTARTPEERAEYRKRGYDAKNFVQSVSKVA
jgi:hypothetical protein